MLSRRRRVMLSGGEGILYPLSREDNQYEYSTFYVQSFIHPLFEKDRERPVNFAGLRLLKSLILPA